MLVIALAPQARAASLQVAETISALVNDASIIIVYPLAVYLDTVAAGLVLALLASDAFHRVPTSCNAVHNVVHASLTGGASSNSIAGRHSALNRLPFP